MHKLAACLEPNGPKMKAFQLQLEPSEHHYVQQLPAMALIEWSPTTDSNVNARAKGSLLALKRDLSGCLLWLLFAISL